MDPKPWLQAARRLSLEKLRAELWRHAERHGGEFPSSRETADVPKDAWRSLDPNGLQLVFVPGSKADTGEEVVAYEPGSFGARRMVLLSNGEIVEMALTELMRRVSDQIAKPAIEPPNARP